MSATHGMVRPVVEFIGDAQRSQATHARGEVRRQACASVNVISYLITNEVAWIEIQTSVIQVVYSVSCHGSVLLVGGTHLYVRGTVSVLQA